MPPSFIRSAPDFTAVVQLGKTPESLVLEFKGDIPDWAPPTGIPNRDSLKREAQKETCRDIAQFANAVGGCLLIGVTERSDPGTGFRVADSINPIAKPDDLRHWIDQSVANFLLPTTFTKESFAIGLPGGVIIAINIPPSRHLVSLWDRADHTVEYPVRSNATKAWMNPDEVERHLMDGSRAAKLALLEAKRLASTQSVDIVGGYTLRVHAREEPWNPPGTVAFGQMHDHWFELHVPTEKGMQSIVLPYGVVREAWVSASGSVSLLLSVRLVRIYDKDIVIEAA